MVKSPTQTCPQAPIRSGRCHGGHGFPTDNGSSYRDWTPSQDGTRVAAQRLRQPSSCPPLLPYRSQARTSSAGQFFTAEQAGGLRKFGY